MTKAKKKNSSRAQSHVVPASFRSHGFSHAPSESASVKMERAILAAQSAARDATVKASAAGVKAFEAVATWKVAEGQRIDAEVIVVRKLMKQLKMINMQLNRPFVRGHKKNMKTFMAKGLKKQLKKAEEALSVAAGKIGIDFDEFEPHKLAEAGFLGRSLHWDSLLNVEDKPWSKTVKGGISVDGGCLDFC